MIKKTAALTEGSLNRQLFSLSWPNIGGMLGIMIFNLTDTFFVSRLGTEALAAMGYTFPVVMFVGSAAAGISLGAGSVLSRAIGKGDHHLMQRTATDGILLSVLFVALISTAGLLTLDPLFRLLGASGESLVLVKDYMFIWFLGAITIIMPPTSDSCLRATGDMIRPFIVMMICAVGNVILDPIFIFGYFGVPAMGIQGAALATVLSRFAGMLATLGFLHFHARLVDFSRPRFKEILESWGRILHVGIPAALTQLMPHVTRAVLTSLAAAAGGAATVAALAAGTRIEGFIQIFMMSYSMALIPLVGQNWGAGKTDRVMAIQKKSVRLAFILGAVTFLLQLLLSGFLARIFSSDPQVISHIRLYLIVTGAASGGLCYMTWVNQSLNASGHPLASARLNAVSFILITIPLAIVGSRLAGFKGILGALAAGQLMGALWAHGEGSRIFRHSTPAPGTGEIEV
ncbi:MAG: MATE family efflux transporter [Spirochaetales bacterium]|nr:MATE family efflux transporter [Spirochaetales bacterium]